MLGVCPHCPHKASTAQLLLKYSLINPGSDWSVFTFLIYENRDQQGLWSLWFSHVSPGLYNSWLGKAACCSQGRGWGKTPSFHPHSSSLRGMWTLSGPQHPGHLHPGFTLVSCGCCVWLALWKKAFELHFDDLHGTTSQGRGMCHSSMASLETTETPGVSAMLGAWHGGQSQWEVALNQTRAWKKNKTQQTKLSSRGITEHYKGKEEKSSVQSSSLLSFTFTASQLIKNVHASVFSHQPN